MESTSRSSRVIWSMAALRQSSVLARAGRLADPARRVREEVDVGPDHGQRGSQLVGDEREELRPRLVELLERLQLALLLALETALLDDPREEGRDRHEERDLARGEPARLDRLHVEDADDEVVPGEGHREHRGEPGQVEAAEVLEARVEPDVGDLDRPAGCGGSPGDPFAQREADLPDVLLVQAVRRRQREAVGAMVQEVERADLHVERLARPVDDRLHQLVPVAGLRRQLGELVQERELAERAQGVGLGREVSGLGRETFDAVLGGERRDRRSDAWRSGRSDLAWLGHGVIVARTSARAFPERVRARIRPSRGR